MSRTSTIKLYATRAAACATLALTATMGVQAGTAAAAATITNAQFAHRADRICARDYKRQAALGPGLVNADRVTRAYMPKASAYLDKIVTITRTEVTRLTALPKPKTGNTARRKLDAALRQALTDEQTAATALHNNDLDAFKTAFSQLILHGRPTGPDYRKLVLAASTAKSYFPFKICGTGPAIYP